ncbi:hypothetical protein ACIQBJ_03920 [Kitasatospora sp. NPDC088391]|uniref:hypothetical protein n=1 Tax=Kitasatospora sp. NPDC088391 TaxID=3364074 RepID=UPI00380EC40F
MPANPTRQRIPEDELAMLCATALTDLGVRLTERFFGTDPETDHLARLRVLVHLQRALAQQCEQTALHAARAGAGYPQLGQAAGITRQGARRRWPGLVPVRTDQTPARTDQAPPAVRPSSSTDRSR